MIMIMCTVSRCTYAEFVACDARHVVKSFGEYSRYLTLYVKR